MKKSQVLGEILRIFLQFDLFFIFLFFPSVFLTRSASLGGHIVPIWNEKVYFVSKENFLTVLVLHCL